MPTAFQDYYAILGVPRTATQKEIKAAFRSLARKHHPDLNRNDPEAEKRFKEINEANEVLSDPEKRRRYDEVGPRWREYEAWERAGRPGPGPFGPPPDAGGFDGGVEYRTVSPEELESLFGDADPFSDFFHSMFGRSSSAGHRGRGRASVVRRGGDVEGSAQITLEEAYSGTHRTVELAEPGRGSRRVEIRIPAGIADGGRVRATGQGGAGAGGGTAGDLYVRISVQPHPRFTRERDDIRTMVEVPLDTALLGGEVAVPTLRGTTAQLRVPEATQNGARMRLRGLGMPRLRGGGHGDLIVEIAVRLPKRLTPAVRDIAEALRREREGGRAAEPTVGARTDQP